MTNTIERILGPTPTSEEVKREFEKRGLSRKPYLIICERYVCGDARYAVHGHQDTESETLEDAVMKKLIIDDEIEKSQ